MESERIPPGEDPDFHLKLGPGGLSDVEFVTGLLQMQHGGKIETAEGPEQYFRSLEGASEKPT